jgi:hypothetical protein
LVALSAGHHGAREFFQPAISVTHSVTPWGGAHGNHIGRRQFIATVAGTALAADGIRNAIAYILNLKSWYLTAEVKTVKARFR